MASMEDVLAALDKETLKQVILASEIQRKYIPTHSVGLNLVLGGGLSRGHQTTFFGGESAGKSTFLLETIAKNQRENPDFSAAWMDTEKTLDREWAARLGVDTQRLLVAYKSSVGDATDMMVKWINAGVDLIVVDSISNLMPKSFYEKDGTMREFDKTGAMGRKAQEYGQMCSMLQGVNFETAMVFISQVRMDLGGFIPTEKASGGKEVGHLDSMRIKLSASMAESNALKGEVQRGDFLIEEIIGRKVKWKIVKNKVNGRYGVGEYNLLTQGGRVGLDVGAEIRDYGVEYGLIEKVGNSRFTINGESINGKDNAAAYIASSPELVEFFTDEIGRVLTVQSTPVEDDD